VPQNSMHCLKLFVSEYLRKTESCSVIVFVTLSHHAILTSNFDIISWRTGTKSSSYKLRIITSKTSIFSASEQNIYYWLLKHLPSLTLTLGRELVNLPWIDTMTWSRLEWRVQTSVPFPLHVPSRLTHTLPSSYKFGLRRSLQ